MKTLLLMRHAKSSWTDHIDDDRDRPLSKKGKKNATQLGELLKDKKFLPDIMLVSTAKRSRQTAEQVIDEIHFRGDLCFLNSLYMAETETIVKEVQRIPDEANCVLVIGHNPGLEGLLQMMTGNVESLSTASVAALSVPVNSWNEVGPGIQAELVHLWRAKDL